MKRQLYFRSKAAILIAAFAAASFGQSDSNSTNQTIHGLPYRMKSLGDLTPIVDANSKLTQLQATEVLLHWLVEEKRDPSPSIRGGGGGPIDSNYIQQQLVLSLGLFGDPIALQWVSRNSTHPRISDEVIVALGMMGDGTQSISLRRVLLSSKNPYMRELATRALVAVGDAEAITDLRRALTDPFVLNFASSDKGNTVLYPVRDAAALAIRALERPDVLQAAEKRKAKYAGVVRDTTTYRVKHDLDLKRILRDIQSLPRKASARLQCERRSPLFFAP